MRIDRVHCDILAAPVNPPWRISTAVMSEMYAAVIRLETDNGITGVGESLVRLAPGAVKAIVEEVLGPAVVGRDPFDIEGIWDDMYQLMRGRGHSRGYFIEAMSGIDIALWDILGKALGQPVYRLLAGHGRSKFPCYASSILLKDEAETVKEGEELVAQGYQALKLKIGRGIAEDSRVIEVLRRALGDSVALMVDANGAYRADEARLLARHLEEQGVYWFEEPLPPDDLSGYRSLRAATSLRLAAGESEFTAAGFRELLEGRLIDIVQPDVARAGGFTGCRRICYLAHAYNVAYAPHTGASGAICLTASLHLAAAMPNFLIYEHMYVSQPLQEILSRPLPQPQKGFLTAPEGPGLGIELDPSSLKRFLKA